MSILQRLTALPDNIQQAVGDFDRRYTSTYMYLQETPNSPLTPVYIHRVRTNGNIECQTAAGIPISVNGTLDKPDLKICLPKTGYYNTEHGLVYLAKKPARQWKRSLSSTFYSIMSPNKTNGLARIDNGYIYVAQEAINPQYVNLNDLTHPKFTNIALSKNFCVATHKGKNFLIYRRCPIALLDYDTFTIKLTHPVMEQEVRDIIKRTGTVKWKLQVM